MEFARLAARAKKNLPVNGSGVPYGTRLNDISFTRPSVSKGYGAVLSCLEYSGTPMTKKAIMASLKKPESHYPTVFTRLRAAKLIKATGHGYKLTRLGDKYVKSWLRAESL